ncbi:MAG: PRA1 family protein [Planctomycetes bacterium]|nr:PRA1 family protein [Planctomycetota bacterium]
MAFWKRKKKEEIGDTAQLETKAKEIGEDDGTFPASVAESSISEERVPEEPLEPEAMIKPQEDLSSGVILRGRKITGKFGKGFWGLISIFVLPPVLMFAFGILVIVFMLIFPILAVILITSVPVVFVTLSVLIIAFPVVFPLLVIFLLITGKGRLLVASEGRWIGIEMFGKSYSLK